MKEEMFTKERRRDKQREGGKGETSEGVNEKKRERSEERSVFYSHDKNNFFSALCATQLQTSLGAVLSRRY